MAQEIDAGVRAGMLGRRVLWLFAVPDDVDGVRRRGLTTTNPQATGRERVTFGRAAPTKVDVAVQPVPIGIFSTSSPVCGASMM